MHFGAAVVDDPTASGGKALCIPYQAGSNGWSAVFSAPRMEMRGQVLFTFWLRAENLPPLTPGLALTLVAHDNTTGQWAHHRETRVYGVNLQSQGYTPITLALDMPWSSDSYGPEVILQWDAPPKGVAPVMYLDKAELPFQCSIPRARSRRENPVQARGARDGAHFLGQSHHAPVEATLVGEASRRRDAPGVFARASVLPGREATDLLHLLGPEEYGREIRVRLLAGDQEVACARDFFAVSKLPLWVAGGTSGDRSYRAENNGAGSFYVGPASGQDSWRGVHYWKKMRRVYFEFFSWAPGDISDLSPTDDLFPGGEGRLTYRSRQTILLQNRMFQSVGIWPVSYVNGTCWAESGYKLFQQHPEWFLYDSNGEIGGYEMDGREMYRRKDDANFDPQTTYNHIFFQACLNHSLPAVQEYVARQFINCGKMMGFSGVRLDVRYLEVYPGERGSTVRKWPPPIRRGPHRAAAVKRIKALVQGTARLRSATTTPLPKRSRTCRRPSTSGAWGAWMLDELPARTRKKPPYHLEYVRRMCPGAIRSTSWAASTTPMISIAGAWSTPSISSTRPFSASSAADGITVAGITTRAAGRRQRRFTTRFSEYCRPRIDWIAELKGEVDVNARSAVVAGHVLLDPASDGVALQVNSSTRPRLPGHGESPL
jgi:hypothetical protein